MAGAVSGAAGGGASGAHLSKEFFELVKSIGEARSKEEEERIVSSEVRLLRHRMAEPGLAGLKMQECVIRAAYAEMLGHDAGFAQIHAVKAAHEKNLACKHVGYLFCTLSLDSDAELLLLLINTVQKDLNSLSFADTCFALTALASQILNEEMVAAVFPKVVKLCTDHSHEAVRRKAVMVVYNAVVKGLVEGGGGVGAGGGNGAEGGAGGAGAVAAGPVRNGFAVAARNGSAGATRGGSAFAAAAGDGFTAGGGCLHDLARRTLCDPAPSVMAASLHLIHELARHDPDQWRDLVPSLVSILKQIIDHRLPRDYDHHKVPAPWLQVKLLAVLATLCRDSPAATAEAREVLLEILARSDASSATASFAVSYECVRTITAVMPDEKLINNASGVVSRFITSVNHNLRYVGVSGLAGLIKVNPALGCRPEHQLVVLDCLEDCDETLKRRTLDLLYQMTNPENVVVVTEKLLDHLRVSSDDVFRADLVQKISHLADSFAPSHKWFVQTLNALFQIAGDLVPPSTAHQLLRLVAEDAEEEEGEQLEDENAGDAGDAGDGGARTRQEIVDMYLELFEHTGSGSGGGESHGDAPSDGTLKCAAWVLGEYGILNSVPGYSDVDNVIRLLVSALRQQEKSISPETQLWLVSAVFKLSVLRFRGSMDEAVAGGGGGAAWPARERRASAEVLQLVQRLRSSRSFDIALRCQMFAALILLPRPGAPFTAGDGALLSELYAFDASCEELELDYSLSFLDRGSTLRYQPYVEEDSLHGLPAAAAAAGAAAGATGGAAAFSGPRSSEGVTSSGSQHLSEPGDGLSNVTSSGGRAAESRAPPPAAGGSVFKVAGPRKWGPEGYAGGPAAGRSAAGTAAVRGGSGDGFAGGEGGFAAADGGRAAGGAAGGGFAGFGGAAAGGAADYAAAGSAGGSDPATARRRALREEQAKVLFSGLAPPKQRPGGAAAAPRQSARGAKAPPPGAAASAAGAAPTPAAAAPAPAGGERKAPQGKKGAKLPASVDLLDLT